MQLATKSTIGERLRYARLNFGPGLRELTQIELAKLSGLKETHISHFERDRRLPSVPNLIKLCRALQVDSDWILGL